MFGIGAKIAIGVLMIVQLLAIGYALRLVRRTKYNIIWFLCIVGCAISFAQHLFYILLNHEPDTWLMLSLDAVASLCIVMAVLFANKLVNYINHLNEQRHHLSQQLLSTAIKTEERSRSQFAKELHDGMGPLLSSVKMSLSAISTDNLNKEQQDILQNSRLMIDEAIRSVREISNNMSPQVLQDFGLSRGVHNFISRIQSFYNVDIEFRSGIHDERFDNNVEVVFYRVICELVNNSLKHSGCSEIRLSLSVSGDELELQYSDNGRGFDPQAVLDCGMGLSNINSRVNTLNGSFDITSSKGKGMRASVKVNVRGAVRPISDIAMQREPRKQRKNNK
jgi:signal transduction histidine kinase